MGRAYALARSIHLLLSQRAVLRLPLRNGREPIPDANRVARCIGHPGRDAQTVNASQTDHRRVHVRIDRDGELDGRIPSGHSQSIPPR